MRTAHKKLTRVTVLAVAIAGLLATMVVPASADVAAFEFNGWAELPAFPTLNSNLGDFHGEAAGVYGTTVLTGDVDNTVGNDATDNLHSTGFSYNEVANAPVGCAAGFASGTAEVDSPDGTQLESIGFDWIRVGATAVIALEIPGADGDGVAVAGFEAHAAGDADGDGDVENDDLLKACTGIDNPNGAIAVDAQVVGAGIYQDTVDVL